MNERQDSGREPVAGGDELARLLDATAAQEALERREGDALRSAPGLADVERHLAAAWGEGGGSRRRSFPWFAMLSLAAAASVLYVLLKPEPERARAPSGEYLNQGSAQVRWTTGATPGAHTIDWTGAPAGSYSVRVLDAATGEVVFPRSTIAATTLEIPAEESAGWPVKVRIEVEVLRLDGARETLHAEVSPAR